MGREKALEGVRGRESNERERVRVSCERDELVLMVVGSRWKNLDDLETPCPEYPGRVLQSFPLKEISGPEI